MERGVTDAELDLSSGAGESAVGNALRGVPSDGRVLIRGSKMEQLTRILADVEEAILGLERRGISLKAHAERQDKATGKLPEVHAVLRGKDYWFTSLDEFNRFREEQEAAGGELSISDLSSAQSRNGVKAHGGTSRPADEEHREPSAGNGQPAEPSQLHFTELHEVRTINRALTALSRFFQDLKIGVPFSLDMLIPQERTGSDQPRYVLRRGEHEVRLEDLRGLPHAVREMGQKGLTVTRFKGLGEMNAEELWETTLDKSKRPLLRVTLEEAGEAERLFTVLMGEDVERRRQFIEDHALEVKNLDV